MTPQENSLRSALCSRRIPTALLVLALGAEPARPTCIIPRQPPAAGAEPSHAVQLISALKAVTPQCNIAPSLWAVVIICQPRPFPNGTVIRSSCELPACITTLRSHHSRRTTPKRSPLVAAGQLELSQPASMLADSRASEPRVEASKSVCLAAHGAPEPRINVESQPAAGRPAQSRDPHPVTRHSVQGMRLMRRCSGHGRAARQTADPMTVQSSQPA